ncbi:MAG: hypothetical protein HOP29_14940 [Phycisphaerales bacterium]|nr:hypothetical protein [Phycisphaerales bacterium]
MHRVYANWVRLFARFDFWAFVAVGLFTPNPLATVGGLVFGAVIYDCLLGWRKMGPTITRKPFVPVPRIKVIWERSTITPSEALGATAFFIPRKMREGFVGDLLEDVEDREVAGWSRRAVWWLVASQVVIAVVVGLPAGVMRYVASLIQRRM